jgi:hypothetical protein
MARLRLLVGIFASAVVLAGGPALAQFGSIFNDSPPRPPANVPDAGPPPDRGPPPYYSNRPPPPYYPRDERGRRPRPDDEYDDQPQRQQPYYGQSQRQRPYYDDEARRPRDNSRSDVPPDEPLPAPMSLPPSSRPGSGSIQSEPLAAPPGTAPSAAPLQGAPPPVAPQQGQGEPQPAQPGQQQPGVARTTPQPLPGLPPGIRQPPGTLQPPAGTAQPGNTAPQQGDEVVVEPPPQRISNPTAVFSGLDKITGRIFSFDVAVNETVQFGALQVTPRVCYSRPPTETSNTDAFVEVDEVTLQGEIKRIFTGWMFKASPGLHAVEHPIYDVWLTDCKGAQPPAVAEVQDDVQPASGQPKAAAPKPPARTQQPQRRPAPPPQQPRVQQPMQQPAIR